MRPPRDRVIEICGREVEYFVKYVHDDGCRAFALEVPVIGGEYYANRHDEHVQQVIRALAAVERHRQTAHYSWVNPLPLRKGEFESLINCDHHKALRLLGFYGRSLRWNDWNVQHPDFDAFACGALDFSCTPWELRMDKELQKMFPPRALPGLEHPLRWRAPR